MMIQQWLVWGLYYQPIFEVVIVYELGIPFLIRQFFVRDDIVAALAATAQKLLSVLELGR